MQESQISPTPRRRRWLKWLIIGSLVAVVLLFLTYMAMETIAGIEKIEEKVEARGNAEREQKRIDDEKEQKWREEYTQVLKDRAAKAADEAALREWKKAQGITE